jgi:exonuclease SbcC
MFGEHITVLYGPNGFGKTSFFDAIDFVVTGEIGRIKSRTQSDFEKMARNLDSGSEESAVMLTFESNGNVSTVKRDLGDRHYALLDGRRTDRKGVLTKLTSGNIPATDRVENFVKLFRASHLFSQEHQELTRDFTNDCELPSEIVSRMLAFEDYANAVIKAGKVNDVIRNTIAAATQEIKTLTEQIATDTRELDRLGQTARVHTNIGALDSELDTLRAKLQAVGIAVTPSKPDTTMVRGWRALLEIRIAQSQAASDRLSILAREVGELPHKQAELAAAKQQLAQNEESLKAIDERRITTELAVQHAEQRLVEMTTKRVDAEASADLYEWFRNNQPVYTQRVARQRQLSAEAKLATEALAKLRTTEDKVVGELRSREAAFAQATENLKIRRAVLAAVRALQETTPKWEANRTRLSAVLQSERAQLKALDQLRVEVSDLAPLLAAASAEEARLAREIAEVDKNQSELRLLVSQLQGHVHTGTCPLCGRDHGSKDELLQRIRDHVAADAASGARVDLTGVRERVKQLTERSVANRQKAQAIDSNLADQKNELDRLKNEINHFEHAASEVGIMVEVGASVSDEIQALFSRLQQEVADLDRGVQLAADTAARARVAVANTQSVLIAEKKENDERQAEISRVDGDIKRLRSDPRLTQVSLDVEIGQVAELEKLNCRNIEEFKVEAAKAETDANQKKAHLGMLRQEITSLKAQMAACRAKLSSLQTAVTQITIQLRESELPVNTSKESMLALIAEQSILQAQLLAVRDATSSLELAMDAATTAAALTTLQQTVRNREMAVLQASTKRDQYMPWLKYFDEVSRILSSQKNAAIANFTDQYGPRASVIQRRLRSVYGFDEIEIKSQESSIRVRVKRHGEELRPTDYFSQSQQQTLFLGLFLTACTSQTWSAFSPVFLDDPVTHFDDLNTYAFLDLLVGLIESEVKQRQFIISTCDEKFLQLARQKFRHLGDRAKFYQFTSVGADGPSVEEIGQ